MSSPGFPSQGTIVYENQPVYSPDVQAYVDKIQSYQAPSGFQLLSQWQPSVVQTTEPSSDTPITQVTYPLENAYQQAMAAGMSPESFYGLMVRNWGGARTPQGWSPAYLSLGQTYTMTDKNTGWTYTAQTPQQIQAMANVATALSGPQGNNVANWEIADAKGNIVASDQPYTPSFLKQAGQFIADQAPVILASALGGWGLGTPLFTAAGAPVLTSAGTQAMSTSLLGSALGAGVGSMAEAGIKGKSFEDALKAGLLTGATSYAGPVLGRELGTLAAQQGLDISDSITGAVGTGLVSPVAALAQGASLEDALKLGLVSGLGKYGTSQLFDAFKAPAEAGAEPSAVGETDVYAAPGAPVSGVESVTVTPNVITPPQLDLASLIASTPAIGREDAESAKRAAETATSPAAPTTPVEEVRVVAPEVTPTPIDVSSLLNLMFPPSVDFTTPDVETATVTETKKKEEILPPVVTPPTYTPPTDQAVEEVVVPETRKRQEIAAPVITPPAYTPTPSDIESVTVPGYKPKEDTGVEQVVSPAVRPKIDTAAQDIATKQLAGGLTQSALDYALLNLLFDRQAPKYPMPKITEIDGGVIYGPGGKGDIGSGAGGTSISPAAQAARAAQVGQTGGTSIYGPGGPIFGEPGGATKYSPWNVASLRTDQGIG